MSAVIEIDTERCTGCMQCVQLCVTQAIDVVGGRAAPSARGCISCGHCAAICPVGAVKLPQYPQWDPEPYTSQRYDVDPDQLLRMMQFRRSIRRFTGEKVSRRQIDKLLQAGCAAPTGSNRQQVRYVVLDEQLPQIEERIFASLARYAARRGREGMQRRYEDFLQDRQKDTLFYGGSQMIAVLAPQVVDGCLAAANIELMAHAMGLGALYCGFAQCAIAENDALRAFFGVTDDLQLATCLVLGHPAVHYRRPAPKKPAEVVWR